MIKSSTLLWLKRRASRPPFLLLRLLIALTVDLSTVYSVDSEDLLYLQFTVYIWWADAVYTVDYYDLSERPLSLKERPLRPLRLLRTLGGLLISQGKAP